MPIEVVTLKVAGKDYTGWSSVSVRRSIENLAASFSLSVVDFDGDPVDFRPGLPVEIYAGRDRLLVGYIDEVSPDIDAGNHSISVSGRSQTADLVDCSAANVPTSWKGSVALSRIVTDLVSPFGIGLSTVASGTDDAVRDFALSIGESPLEAIARLCADRGILPIETPSGNLHLTNTGNSDAIDALNYGQNIKKASARISNVERFSKYTVKGGGGSSGAGWGGDDAPSSPSVSVTGTAEDDGIERFRPKIFKADDTMTTKSAQTRAAWEAQTRRGKGVDLSVEIYGWRQSSGALWTINLSALVNIKPVRIEGVRMIVSEITYEQTDSGTTAKLVLKRAETFQAEPKKIAKAKGGGGMKWDPKA